MITFGLAEVDCPDGVVDRMLWVDAQHIQRRHVANRFDQMCVWCGREWPCPPRRLAERAELASYQPWREANRWPEFDRDRPDQNRNDLGRRPQPIPRSAVPRLMGQPGLRLQRNGRMYGRPRTSD
jgi:hypothetical protein